MENIFPEDEVDPETRVSQLAILLDISERENEYHRDRLSLISSALKWWASLPADSGQTDGEELAYLVTKAMNEPGWHGGYGHYLDCEPGCRGDVSVEVGEW